jgi:hypothetical protein
MIGKYLNFFYISQQFSSQQSAVSFQQLAVSFQQLAVSKWDILVSLLDPREYKHSKKLIADS